MGASREKWRLALDMIEEMTGPGGWAVLDLVTAARGVRPVVAADIGYGDNALFREQRRRYHRLVDLSTADGPAARGLTGA